MLPYFWWYWSFNWSFICHTYQDFPSLPRLHWWFCQIKIIKPKVTNCIRDFAIFYQIYKWISNAWRWLWSIMVIFYHSFTKFTQWTSSPNLPRFSTETPHTKHLPNDWWFLRKWSHWWLAMVSNGYYWWF